MLVACLDCGSLFPSEESCHFLCIYCLEALERLRSRSEIYQWFWDNPLARCTPEVATHESMKPCEVCNGWASIFVQDRCELPPVKDSSGKMWTCWKPSGVHYFCHKHQRGPKIVRNLQVTI